MKKLLIVLFSVFAMANANAAVLSFDDLNLTSDYQAMPDLNYGGFTWDSRWFAGNTSTHANYANSATSGTQYLSNGDNVNNLTVSAATAFDFDGAWFGAPGGQVSHPNPAEWINITAYDSLNNLIGSTGQISLTNLMTFVAAGFQNVSSLVISRGNGWFTMDDFTYDGNVSAVPVPAALFLFAPALLGFLGLRRKATTVA
ncbi:MAG: hypothetical protein ACKE8G_00740 [Methylophagaceae bacterium]